MSGSVPAAAIEGTDELTEEQSYLHPNSLENLALQLAEDLRDVDRDGNHNPIPARIEQLSVFFKKAYRYYENNSQTGENTSGAAEWILDNYFVIKQALRQVEEGLPTDFYRNLPKVDVAGRKLPRVYSLAYALTQFSQNHLDMDRLRDFVADFQSIVTLKIGEIWALPLFLRLSILEFFVGALTRMIDFPLPASPPTLQPALSSDALSSPEIVPGQTLVANSILSLRLLATQDWKAFFEASSKVDTVLCEDPAGVYSSMGFEAHNHYRDVIEALALASPLDEVTIAREAVALARAGDQPRSRHLGYYLIDEGRPVLEAKVEYRVPLRIRVRRWLYDHATLAYLGSITTLTAFICLLVALYGFGIGVQPILMLIFVLLAALPASSVAVEVVNWLVIHILPPKTLPRFDFSEGIPPEFSTMVVIPAMMSSEGDVQSLLGQLERHYLSNAGPNVSFALLTDFPDAPKKEMPEDARLIAAARKGIKTLNSRYAIDGNKPFYIFHRERTWNPSEDCWMGWERKRGKLMEFNRLLSGEAQNSTYLLRTGKPVKLRAIRYVVTVDADTILPRGSVHEMVGTLAHPLNRAEFDPASGELVAGYTILQPRVQVRPSVANRSIFSRVYSGDTVLDLYTRAVSDAYQDLFGEGIYVGKGIYDVKAFERSLSGRVPENALLSHDLFEGIQGRCGLVSNIVLFEDYPPHYLAYTHRLHRWIRGDWQLVPWLFSNVPAEQIEKTANSLSTIDRWKVFDNLRRSLVRPAIMALLVGAWLLPPGPILFWMILAISPFFFSVFLELLNSIDFQEQDQPTDLVKGPVSQTLFRAILQTIFLPHEAWIAVDAIITTLVRVFIKRKRMLQWITSAHTLTLFGRELKINAAWEQMIVSPLSAIALLVFVFLLDPFVIWLASPFLVAWTLSPFIAYWISRPTKHDHQELTNAQLRELRLLARKTWLFFEHFVGPEDHWLPPDHFQEDPRGLVAHRTSPTNIGLLLVSTLAAHDFGFIGTQELALRLNSTLDGMEGLERQRGHFLNWYDTQTLNPLPPRYISTVDSGNLAASLMALSQGCHEAANSPIVRWRGFTTTLEVLEKTLQEAQLGDAADDLFETIAGLKRVAGELEETKQYVSQSLIDLFSTNRQELENLLSKMVEETTKQLDAPTLRELSIWIERSRDHLSFMQRDLERFCPWLMKIASVPAIFNRSDIPPELDRAWDKLLSNFTHKPSLREIPSLSEAALESLESLRNVLPMEENEAWAWCDGLAEDLVNARAYAIELLADLEEIAVRAEAYFRDMGFSFLFNPLRKIFHIGYNVDSGRLDANYYDLLASEARITSLLAIAKGDIPQSHWLYLARPITQINGKRMLLSWSGTMFEYLMPVLFTRQYANTLLEQSCQTAIERQVAYGRSKKIPWGVSESSFYYFDANQVYQYRAFGIPELGYKRGLSEDQVVAPYASVLALPFEPLEVMDNLQSLQEMGMCGVYGLYESVDFTEDRLNTGQQYAIVQSYMAHHQGMILLSLSNQLCENSTVRRFHADPRIGTVDLLLQEQTPESAPIEYPHPQETGKIHPVHPEISLDDWEANVDSPYPQVHFLSNGNYSLLITASGGGYSQWRDIALTRWRADTTLDHCGCWLYIQEADSGQFWSASHQPVRVQQMYQGVRFYPHTVEFMWRDEDLSLGMRISIAPEADVEIRRITVTNHSPHERELALTSYAETALAPQITDQRHPAFNKLFIESEYIEDEDVLLLRRRPRSSDEKPVFLAHFIASPEKDVSSTGYETNRMHFVGRGHTPHRPLILNDDFGKLTNTTGATLDPVLSMQAGVNIPAYATTQLAFLTLAAGSRNEALDLARQYHRWEVVARSIEDSSTQEVRELGRLNLNSAKLEQYQKLLSALLYPNSSLRAGRNTLAANSLSQPGLWAFSISGDYPILLVSLEDDAGMMLLEELLQAHRYWRRRGLMIDLVILNRHESGYQQDLQGRIQRLFGTSNHESWLNKRGGIFVVRFDQLSEAERTLLFTVARVVLEGSQGPLARQLTRMDATPVRLPQFVSIRPPATDGPQTPPLERPSNLLFDNGTGGFAPDGCEYVIYLDKEQWTPLPWSNVIANPDFGFLVTDTGMGSTWSVNSGENRLTPWQNDPVSDPPSEALYLRDEETGQVWTPTPLPARDDAPYLIRHGIGYSIFEHNSHGLKQRLKTFAVPDQPVKIVQLRLENTTDTIRRINATYYAEWVLGSLREESAPFIIPEFSASRFALLARNSYNIEFSQRVAFLAATRELQGLTGDRTEFLGRDGSYANPAALQRSGLSARVEPGLDPCAAIQLLLWLEPGETKEVTFLLGQGDNREHALELIRRYQDVSNVQAANEALTHYWDGLIGKLKVSTPDPGMDILLNHWLPYQSISCRLWGRTAFYQSSGAYGFRDQLQDVLAYLPTRPDLAREHILRAARHQFEQGDVLHWWHPPSDKGIRTRISDNMLWLPYVTASYAKVTGDLSILEEKVTFLTAEPLKPDEEERYGQFLNTEESWSLFEHCKRAIQNGSTSGRHNLPLIRAGDWNDGLNRVGIEGQGESIWLGWFLYATLMDFAELCAQISESEQAAEYRKQARALSEALEEHGWDGEWYRRAYYDDGSPLGSSANRECQIDSISQSWSVFSGAAPEERVRQALSSLDQKLVRRDDRLILLLTPSFDRSLHDPGYIKGYVPGTRENGGQYTHAALWAVWAFAKQGDGDRAFELFQLVNPVYYAETADKSAKYKVEPYVVAADVYSNPDHLGRGGWTWYTGSASWMYRLGVEAILGLQREGASLKIDPCIPKVWQSFELEYRSGESTYHVHVDNPEHVNRNVVALSLDGKALHGDRIPLTDDGETHQVIVKLGKD